MNQEKERVVLDWNERMRKRRRKGLRGVWAEEARRERWGRVESWISGGGGGGMGECSGRWLTGWLAVAAAVAILSSYFTLSTDHGPD